MAKYIIDVDDELGFSSIALKRNIYRKNNVSNINAYCLPEVIFIVSSPAKDAGIANCIDINFRNWLAMFNALL